MVSLQEERKKPQQRNAQTEERTSFREVPTEVCELALREHFYKYVYTKFYSRLCNASRSLFSHVLLLTDNIFRVL